MRMGGIEAAVLSIKLKYIDSWNKRRKEITHHYREHITNPGIKLQQQPALTDSVYHLFVVTVDDRDALQKHLVEHGIFPGMHYPVPCHVQKAYLQLGYRRGDCPNAEYLADHCLSLPMYAELSDVDVKYIVETLNAYPSRTSNIRK
jgi:dTDP-4-amino-4,6-dideoxygalactose transaminase